VSEPVDLRLFCANLFETYEPIRKPFSRAGYTWATDRSIAVRVPLREDVPENPDAPVVERIWTDAPPNGRWHKVKPFNLPEARVECDACNGRGKSHDCPSCTCACPNCAGVGIIREIQIIKAGPLGFQWKNIDRIFTLPGLEIQLPAEGAYFMHFRFKGGEGVVMKHFSYPRFQYDADILTGPVA